VNGIVDDKGVEGMQFTDGVSTEDCKDNATAE
jgi:hypothetical protein